MGEGFFRTNWEVGMRARRSTSIASIMLVVVVLAAISQASQGSVPRAPLLSVQADLNPSNMPHPAGQPPSRTWLKDFGIWALGAVIIGIALLAISAWLVMRSGASSTAHLEVEEEPAPSEPAKHPRPKYDLGYTRPKGEGKT
jgi:hypothetical protein